MKKLIITLITYIKNIIPSKPPVYNEDEVNRKIFDKIYKLLNRSHI